MALVKDSLQPVLLNGTEKGSSEMLQEEFFTIDEFTYVKERISKQTDEKTGEVTEVVINDDMICFSVKEIENTYFWASTSLYDFFMDQIMAYTKNPESIPEVSYDEDRKTYRFMRTKDLDHDITVKYGGKVPLKSNPKVSCNTWILRA